MHFNFKTHETFSFELDKNDSLKKFRNEFYFANKNTIYLDGNSLGRLPVKTKTLLADIIEKQWGTELIESWNKHWYSKSAELGDKIAQIIGASKGEVIVTDNTSVNLYKLAFAALKFQTEKTEILSDIHNFPTDLYILQGVIKQFGTNYQLKLAKSDNEISIHSEMIKPEITNNTALVLLSLVSFKSSYLYNARKITDWAHQKGALVCWDLSHAAGAVPVALNNINADLAVGCTYKYLNGGPGSPAFLYVRKDLQDKLYSPIQGWFGDHKPFEFELNYRPSNGIQKFLSGTPPVLNQMAIEPGLDILIEAGMENIRKKSIQQTEYFIWLTQTVLSEYNFKIGSPIDAATRGSHVSIQHNEAYRICQALIHPINVDLKIIPDFREPNNIRFGITPLYTTFNEIWKTIFRIKQIVESKEYEKLSDKRKSIT